MKAKQKNNIQIQQLFISSSLLAVLLFVVNTMISNRLNNNGDRIICNVAFGALAILPFLIGAIWSLKIKNSRMIAYNILLITAIVIWTAWISLILYAFKDFQLVLPS